MLQMYNDFDPSGTILIALFFLVIVLLKVFGRVNQGNSLLNSIKRTWFWIVPSLYFFYAGFGFKYCSMETIGTTHGTRNKSGKMGGFVVDYEYQYNNKIIKDSQSRPENYANLYLNGAKYKVRVFKALFYHVSDMDFSKPVE